VRTLDNQHCPRLPRIAAKVYVTMDLPTLLGLRDNPAELHGYGPLPAPLARILAADNGWQRLIVDPLTGAPKDLGRLRRFPDTRLREWIRLRDRVCLFPGCYRSAVRCALDHRIEAGHGGGTNKNNLAPLCPKHHRIKDAGWRYVLQPDRIIWTSPHHDSYTRYLPDPDLTIPADLQTLGDHDTANDERPIGEHDDPTDYMVIDISYLDRDPRPPRPLPADHPNHDPEPPDPEPPEPEPPQFEPPDFEPPQFEPPQFEPSHFEPPDFEPPDFESPDYGPPVDEPPAPDSGP
jgi:hypothetical protein